MYGIKESSIFNAVLVTVKIAILLFFVVFALTKFSAVHLEPLFPNGVDGMFRGAAMVYFAFLGFDGVSVDFSTSCSISTCRCGKCTHES